MKKRKAANGKKNEEWAASVVLDQLLEDVLTVKAYIATNPEAPAVFEKSSGASSAKGKGKISQFGIFFFFPSFSPCFPPFLSPFSPKRSRAKPARELKNSDYAPLASVCVKAAMRFGFEDLAKQISQDLNYKITSKDKVCFVLFCFVFILFSKPSSPQQYSDVPRTDTFVEFQLRCMGPRLPRPVGKPDDRTTGEFFFFLRGRRNCTHSTISPKIIRFRP